MYTDSALSGTLHYIAVTWRLLYTLSHTGRRHTLHWNVCVCVRILLVQAPLCSKRLLDYPGVGELEGASLLGRRSMSRRPLVYLRHRRALLGGPQVGHQLGDQSAGLLWLEVADLLRHVHQLGHALLVAPGQEQEPGQEGEPLLLWSLLHQTALATYLHRNLSILVV